VCTEGVRGGVVSVCVRGRGGGVVHSLVDVWSMSLRRSKVPTTLSHALSAAGEQTSMYGMPPSKNGSGP
jgi:hypothetical protein